MSNKVTNDELCANKTKTTIEFQQTKWMTLKKKIINRFQERILRKFGVKRFVCEINCSTKCDSITTKSQKQKVLKTHR